MKKSHKKHKAKSSVKRRFVVTKTGKVLRRSPGTRHLRRKKSKKQMRRLKRKRVVPTGFAKKVKKILGIR